MAKRDVKLEEEARDAWSAAQKEWSFESGDRLERLEADHRFLAGDQWPEEDKRRLKNIRAGGIVVPELQSHVDAVAGQEATQRFAVQYKPRNPAEPDAFWSQALNEGARHLLQASDAEHEVSWSYRDSVAGGIGFVTYRFDTERDPEGSLMARSEVPFQVAYDPYARQQNLMDARWLAVMTWVPREVVRQRWPHAADILAGSEAGDNPGMDLIGAGFTDRQSPELYGEGGRKSTEAKRFRDLKVVHFQWWAPGKVLLWMDPTTGTVRSGDMSRYQRVAEAMLQTGQQPPPYVERSVKRAHEAFIHGDVVLEARLCVVNDFATHPMTCFPRKLRNCTEWYGLVSKGKDVQLLMNKLHTLAVHLTASATKDLVIAEESAFEDWTDAEIAFASPGRILKANNGAVSTQKIMIERAGGLPPVVSQLLELSNSLVPRSTGVNLFQVGAVDNLSRTSNTAIQSVQRAGQTVLSQPVDALRRFRIRQGRYLAMWIEVMMDEQDLARILSPELAAQVPPKSEWPDLTKFDVVVDEAPSTASELERFWSDDNQGLMLQLFGDPMTRPEGPTMIDMLRPGIPAELRTRWKNDIQQRQMMMAQNPPADGGGGGNEGA